MRIELTVIANAKYTYCCARSQLPILSSSVSGLRGPTAQTTAPTGKAQAVVVAPPTATGVKAGPVTGGYALTSFFDTIRIGVQVVSGARRHYALNVFAFDGAGMHIGAPRAAPSATPRPARNLLVQLADQGRAHLRSAHRFGNVSGRPTLRITAIYCHRFFVFVRLRSQR